MKNIPTLIFLALVLFAVGCKKEKSPTSHADKMNGLHKWHGTYHYSLTPQFQPSTIIDRTITDTPIEVKVTGNTVTFGTTALHLDSFNTSKHTLYYSGPGPGTGIGSHTELTYDYQADSIAYHSGQLFGHNGSEETQLKTP